MRLLKLLALISLSVFSVGAVAEAVTLGSGGLGPGTGSGMQVSISGKMKGKLQLPELTTSGVQDGQLKGVLAHNGKPKFVLSGKLTPTPGVPGKKGEVKGVLKRIVPGQKKPVFFAKVKGVWTADKDGVGSYKLVIIKPSKTPGTAGKVIGKMKGKLVDKDKVGPQGKDLAGHFGGVWKLGQ